MATRAEIFRRTGAPAEPAVGEAWTSGPDAYRLRPLPAEDVYFYVKKIDNSRVVREGDPDARKRAWQAGAKGLAVAGLLILLLIPKALGMVAGYQIHQLAATHERLAAEKAAIEVEDARLRSPDRLEQLARQMHLVNPDPRQVVVLNSVKADSALAMNVGR
jgi:hypothetical protein